MTTTSPSGVAHVRQDVEFVSGREHCGAWLKPAALVDRVRCPLLMRVCLHDVVVPAEAALDAAGRGGDRVRLETYDCRHFDIYHGRHFAEAVAEQVAFFESEL